MKRIGYFITSILLLVIACKNETSNFKLEILSFVNGGFIPDKYAFCVPDENGKFEFGENLNPHLRWSGIPNQTKSLVLFMIDKDRPKNLGEVNVKTTVIPAIAPRTEFYHWVVIDIPVTVREIPEGAASQTVTKGGKAVGKAPYGVRGLNDYTYWFKGDFIMGGQYAGYDGPCPPWNDEKIHRYVFRLHALDIAQLGLRGRFTPEEVLKAMEGHIITTTEWEGRYTANSNLRESLSSKSDS